MKEMATRLITLMENEMRAINLFLTHQPNDLRATDAFKTVISYKTLTFTQERLSRQLRIVIEMWIYYFVKWPAQYIMYERTKGVLITKVLRRIAILKWLIPLGSHAPVAQRPFEY